MESVLITINKMLGIDEYDMSYDTDIIVHINTQLFTLNQVGVNLTKKSISDRNILWTDLLPTMDDYEAIKSYIYIQVKLLFDPPTSSALLTSLTNKAAEYESRLSYQK